MNFEEIKATVAEIQFRKYTFLVQELAGRFCVLRAGFKAPCIITGKLEFQFTRDWLLTEKMTRSEIVATALKCVLASEEHEAREDFIYRGQRIFGPHFDVDQLHALAFAHNPPKAS